MGRLTPAELTASAYIRASGQSPKDPAERKPPHL